MSLAKREIEEIKPRVNRLVEKFLGFSEPVLAATAVTCISSGLDRKKTAEKLGSLLDAGKAEKLADKISSLISELKESQRSAKKRHHDNSDGIDTKRSKTDKDGDKKNDMLSASEIKSMMVNAQKMIEERKKSLLALKGTATPSIKGSPKSLPSLISSTAPGANRSADEKARKIAALQAQIKNKLSSGVLGIDPNALPSDKPTPLILDSEGRTVDI